MYLVFNHELVGLSPINAPNDANRLIQLYYLLRSRAITWKINRSLASRYPKPVLYKPAGPSNTLPVQHARLAAFWTVAGVLGTLAVFPYALAINPAVAAQLPVPLPALVAVQTAQTGILLLLMSWVGLRLGQPLGLDSPFARALVGGKIPAVSRRALAGAVLAGSAAGLVLLILDRLLQPLLPPTIQPLPTSIALWKRLLAAFYGGITEELLLRLFLMTLIAWVIWKTAYKAQLPPDTIVFTAAIVAAAVLFGIGHLPAAALFWPLTPLVVARVIALNALGGIAFGYIYWQWGLEYCMLAHFCADLVLHGVGGS
jgi:hypothetical protein